MTVDVPPAGQRLDVRLPIVGIGNLVLALGLPALEFLRHQRDVKVMLWIAWAPFFVAALAAPCILAGVSGGMTLARHASAPWAVAACAGFLASKAGVDLWEAGSARLTTVPALVGIVTLAWSAVLMSTIFFGSAWARSGMSLPRLRLTLLFLFCGPGWTLFLVLAHEWARTL